MTAFLCRRSPLTFERTQDDLSPPQRDLVKHQPKLTRS